jgi:hypothetical protein
VTRSAECRWLSPTDHIRRQEVPEIRAGGAITGVPASGCSLRLLGFGRILQPTLTSTPKCGSEGHFDTLGGPPPWTHQVDNGSEGRRRRLNGPQCIVHVLRSDADLPSYYTRLTSKAQSRHDAHNAGGSRGSAGAKSRRRSVRLPSKPAPHLFNHIGQRTDGAAGTRQPGTVTTGSCHHDGDRGPVKVWIDHLDRGDVPWAEAVALSDRLAALDADRRLPVHAERGRGVMHDRPEVVRA